MSDRGKHDTTDDEEGIRLDRWFKRHFPEVTHGQLQKMLRTGQIRIDGKRAETSTRLNAGQNIRVPPQVTSPPQAHYEEQSLRVKVQLKKMVLYQDDDVLVLNKPAGLAVQGGTGLKENLDDMLAGFQNEAHLRPKLVHRLDRDTSGVLLLARTPFAASRLAESFRHHDTQKIYWALTVGVPKPEQGSISVPLIKTGELMTVDVSGSADAKSALTSYQVYEKANHEAAFVVLSPMTGRTHQLRVHMAYLGTPILGDRLYQPDLSTSLPLKELGKGLHLHARRLVIPHPRKGIIDIQAPLSPAMIKTWEWFGFDPKANVDFSSS